MITVLFETHATSLDNEAGLASGHYDVALSPVGEEQARALGDRFRGREVDAIFCSDLQRSYRTAELAFGGCGIPIVRDRRLRECDYGTMTRKPRPQVISRVAERVDQPFPAGESYRQAASRMKEFLGEIAVRFDGKTILLVGHRATQYGLDHWLNGQPLESVLTAPWQWQPGWRYQLDPSREPWA
jgi:broad specificity phosphatase PhoE